MVSYNFPLLGVPWNAQRNKNIAPLVGAAMVSGVASLLGGGLSAIFGHSTSNKSLQAQREANATNLQIARETNEANRNLWREQSEYNTPVNQMERFRAAGINPYMAVSQITGGNAETAPVMQGTSVDPSYNSTAAAAEMQGYSRLADSIPAAVNFALDAHAKMSQNRILESEAKYSESMAFQRFIEQMQRNNLLTKENQRALMENFYLPKLNDMNLQTMEQHLKESNERILTMQTQRDVMEVSKKYNIALTAQVNQDISNSITQLSWNIREARSRIAANYASSEQSLAAASVARETKKAVAEQVKLFKAQTKKTLREAGLLPTGKKADSYVDALVDKAWQDAETSRQGAFGLKLRNKYENDWQQSFWYPVGNSIQHMSPLGAFLK